MASSIKEIEGRGLLPRWVLVTMGVIFIIMAVFGIIASENPDGLEKTMEEVGAEGTDSGVFSFGETFTSDLLTMAAGMIGAFVILVAIVIVVKKLKSPA